MRILVLIFVDLQSDTVDPVPSQFVAHFSRNPLAFQAKRDIVEHRPMIETRVVLKNHTPIRPRPEHGFTLNENFTGRWGMLWIQSRDQP